VIRETQERRSSCGGGPAAAAGQSCVQSHRNVPCQLCGPTHLSLELFHHKAISASARLRTPSSQETDPAVVLHGEGPSDRWWSAKGLSCQAPEEVPSLPRSAPASADLDPRHNTYSGAAARKVAGRSSHDQSLIESVPGPTESDIMPPWQPRGRRRQQRAITNLQHREACVRDDPKDFRMGRWNQRP
jgi:hypothetical protein